MVSVSPEIYLKMMGDLEGDLFIAAADALAVEVEPFGIKVLNAVPGGIRTKNWVNVYVQPASPNALLPPLAGPGLNSNSTFKSAEDGARLEDYAPIRKKMLDFMYNIPMAHVPSDSIKTAKAIIDTVCGRITNSEGKVLEWPDLNFLPLGPDAEKDIRNKCERILKVLDEYKDVARGVAADDMEFQ